MVRLVVRLVLAVGTLLLTLDVGHWLELPIQCSYNVGCYYKVFEKVVVKSLGENAFVPTSECLMQLWRHAVKDTQARETYFLAVCSLNWTCWQDVCPSLSHASWHTWPSVVSCLTYGKEEDHCGAAYVPLTVADVQSTCWMPSGLDPPTTEEFKIKLKSGSGAKGFRSNLHQRHCGLDPSKREHVEAFLAKEVQQIDEDKDGHITAQECKAYVGQYVAEEDRAVLLGGSRGLPRELCNAFTRFGSFEPEQAADTCNFGFDAPSPPSHQHGAWTLVDMLSASQEKRTDLLQNLLQILESDSDVEGNMQVSYRNRIVFILVLQQGSVGREDEAAMRTITQRFFTFGVILVGGTNLDAAAKTALEREINQVSERSHIYWFASDDDDGLWDYMKSLPHVDAGDTLQWQRKETGQMKEDIKQLQREMGQMKDDPKQLQREMGQMKEDLRQLQKEMGQMKEDLEQLQAVVRRLRIEIVGLKTV